MAACYCAGVFQRASIAGGCGKAGAIWVMLIYSLSTVMTREVCCSNILSSIARYLKIYL
jgi:hypothetical protein